MKPLYDLISTVCPWLLLTLAVFILCCTSAFSGTPGSPPPQTIGNSSLATQKNQEPVELGPIELGPVIVTSEKLQDYINKNPAQVVSIGIKDISKQNFLTIGDALDSLSGVDVTQSGSGLGARISIRGGGGSGSVLVLVDGRPAATMQYGGVDLSSLPIDMVKKITVFKPPVPAWLGPGSSGGAVYIETRKTATRKKTSKKGRIRILGGSYGESSGSASCRFGKDAHQMVISSGALHKDGKRSNSRKDQGYLNLHYGHNTDAMDYEINGKVFVSDHRISGPTYNPTPNASQRYEKASLDIKLSGQQNTVDYEIKTFLDVKTLSDQSNTGSIAELDAYTAGMATDLFFALGNDVNEFRMGGLVTQSHVDHTLSGEHERTLCSLNGVYNFSMAPFKFVAGLRGDYTSDFDFSPSGNAGISLEVTPTTVFRANAGYSENLPSFGQLYQPSHGSIDQVRGNPALDKEKIMSVNLGVSKGFDGGHTLEISLFRTNTLDLIKYRRGADLINRPDNISKAWKQGVETSLKFHLSDQSDLSISHVWQETKNDSNGKQLSHAPHHLLKVKWKTSLAAAGTKVELGLKGVSEQYTDTENTAAEQLDSYITIEAKLVQPVTVFGLKTEWFIHLHNLLDEDFSSHYGYPDDGFKFQAGLNINF